jgi:transposase InsO family protein
VGQLAWRANQQENAPTTRELVRLTGTLVDIFQYINGFYNARRRHLYLGDISPLAFEAKAA